MLLYGEGQEAYFDSHLIQYMITEKNDKAISILQRHDGDDWGQLIDSSGWTLLHYAAAFGNSEITEFILHYGKCEINTQEFLGRTPLMLALLTVEDDNKLAVVFEILLKANADINVIDNEGQSTVQLIFDLGAKCLPIIGKLFQYSTWQEIIKCITPEELAKKFDEIGLTPKDAFSWGQAEVMKIVLSREKKNTINARDGDNDNKSMLHVAVQKNMIEMATVLMDFGADVDALDNQNATPLFYLYNQSSAKDSDEFLEMVKTLLNRAKFLTTCTRHRCMQVSNALIFGSNDAIEIVLQAKVDVNTTDEEGNTVLHYLAKNVNADLYKLMRGLNFNVNVSNEEGCTPLYLATTSGSLETVKFWLEYGADINKANKLGKTPLHNVFPRSAWLKMEIMELLVQYGADPQVCLQLIASLDWDTVNNLFNVFILTSHRAVSSSIADPILASLAIISGLGLEITDRTRWAIRRIPSWPGFFNTCEQQVQRMKETIFYGKVSLFQFLTESQKKMNVHARNANLAFELEKAIQRFEAYSPYPGLLRHRLAAAIELIDLREKAMDVISSLINANMNNYPAALECIVDNLSKRDMEMLLLL